LRHFVPQNPDLWVAVNLWLNGVCKEKNRLIGVFLMFLREAQQTPKTRGLLLRIKSRDCSKISVLEQA
jgi:hypothetical protein